MYHLHMTSLNMRNAASLPAKILHFDFAKEAPIHTYVEYLGIGMAKPSCDDLAIGISMRRGCFLITPGFSTY